MFDIIKPFIKPGIYKINYQWKPYNSDTINDIKFIRVNKLVELSQLLFFIEHKEHAREFKIIDIQSVDFVEEYDISQ
jgi:hypothetical protein